MITYNIGDTVKIIELDPWEGNTGVVCYSGEGYVSVDFGVCYKDFSVNKRGHSGHNCGGHAKSGHGWNYSAIHLNQISIKIRNVKQMEFEF